MFSWSAFIFGIVIGSIITSVLWSAQRATGVLSIDRNKKIKLDIDDLDNVHTKKHILLHISQR